VSRPPAPLPNPSVRADQQLLAALAEIYRDLTRDLERAGATCAACGDCCHLADYGHELWLTEVELAYLLRASGARVPTASGVCPYLEDGRCAAREGRALSCRIFHCDLDRAIQHRLHEKYLERLRGVAAGRGIELGYGELLASLAEAARGQAGSIPRANE